MDPRPRPLIATADPLLLDDLLRIATAAATEVAVAQTPDRALSLWRHAPLVVVGAELRASLSTADPPPGRHVFVARASDDAAPVGREDPLREAPARRGGAAATDRGMLLLPRDESVLVGLLARAASPTEAPAPTVSVIGGCGGAGTSLLAVALALAGARAGRDTALLDADPLGCGPDLYLGCDSAPPPAPEQRTGWGDLVRRRGRVRWQDLRAGLPGTPGVSVLTWSRAPASAVPLPVGAARSALSSARDGADLVVADLPRAFDPATVVFLNRSDLVLVVVPADVPSVVAATRVVSRLREEAAVVRVVVRGARGDLSADVVAASLGLELGADLPQEPRLDRLLAAGGVPARHPRSPLARFADRVVAGLPSPEPVR
ncbi:septum site-determining protein Ssd [Nocardiopsis sp. NPDC058631]|uniref:septum site-determining protein Ssd n=1 Tax=Nocardiopsis sp. NPDC058631 TaxID=3346566 RepID=UPI00365458B4